MARIIPELELLLPCDPSNDLDSDEWPEFELTNASVHYPGDRNAITSLLDATEYNALVVSGQIESLPDHLTHLIKKPSALHRTEWIEIDQVRSFAYGQYSDGSIAVWAAGKAGWFSLKPARAFRAIYNDMVEAIKTFYFVVDSYSDARRPERKQRKRQDTPSSMSVQDLFKKYAKAKFDDEDRIGEAAELIYKHHRFLFASMIAGKEGIAWGSTSVYRHLMARFPAEHAESKARVLGPDASRGGKEGALTSESSAPKRKKGRPRAISQTDLVNPDDTISIATSRTSIRSAKLEKSRNAPHQKQMSARLHTTRSKSASEVGSIADLPSNTSTSSDSEDDALRHSHKGKSTLRPKPIKSFKGLQSVTDDPSKENEVLDDEEANGDGPPSSPTMNKRPLVTIESDRPEPPKRRRSEQQHKDEGVDIASTPSSSAELIGSPSDVNHVRDPVQEDTWVCALDGCTHKVYMASESNSQQLIREHYALHAYDDDERVKLVKRLKAPSLPVGHLMERVKLQAKKEGFPSSRAAVMGPAGDRFPDIKALSVAQRP